MKPTTPSLPLQTLVQTHSSPGGRRCSRTCRFLAWKGGLLNALGFLFMRVGQLPFWILCCRGLSCFHVPVAILSPACGICLELRGHGVKHKPRQSGLWSQGTIAKLDLRNSTLFSRLAPCCAVLQGPTRQPGRSVRRQSHCFENSGMWLFVFVSIFESGCLSECAVLWF